MKINIKMTWVGCLPYLMVGLEHGTEEGKRIAREELSRMAKAADKGIALAERVARLNKDAGEIGPGMLASLIDDANLLLGNSAE